MRARTTTFLLSVVFLASCASPAPQVTVTVAPSSTHNAILTSTETPEPTPAASATTGLHGMYYDPDYMDSFVEIKDSLITIGAEQIQAVVGLDASGQEVTLAAELTMFDGTREMVRVSEYKDQNGNAFYSFFNPDTGVTATGAFQLTPDAAEVIWERLFEELSEGQFAGMSPEKVKAQVLADAAVGKLTDLQVLRSIGGENPDLLMKTVTVQADFSKPMEQIIIGSMEQFRELPVEWQEAILDPERATSGAIFVGTDGHLISVGVDISFATNFWGFDRNGMEVGMDKYNLTLAALRRNSAKEIGLLSLNGASLFSEINDPRAFWEYIRDGEVSKNENSGLQIAKSFSEVWWDDQVK